FPVPSRLMSQKTPEARKPLGATMEPGMSLNFAFMKLDGSANDSRGSLRSDQPRRFGEAAQEVKALHRLAAGAFDQVVLGAEDDETAGAWIQSPGDFDDVGARHILGVGQSRPVGIQETDERFVPVSRAVTGSDLPGEGFHRRRLVLRRGRQVPCPVL